MTTKTHQKQGCLSIFLPFLGRSQSEPAPETSTARHWSEHLSESEDLPYRLRDDFLSQAEFSFYKVLSSLAGTRLTIQSKVRLADIFFIARPNENMTYLSRIAQRHLDFLICDSITMKPLLGIELDDSSHQRSDRQDRDEFVDKVFKTANLPLLRVPVKREYNARELAAQIAPLLKDKMGAPAAAPQPENSGQANANAVPLCPKCDMPMLLRTVSQGQHKGKQFYGCRNYPQCREMKPAPTQKAERH